MGFLTLCRLMHITKGRTGDKHSVTLYFKSCSVGKCRPPKNKGRLDILLFALPLRFWFHPSSLQFAGLQSGVWRCRNPQASFLASRYETKKDGEKSHSNLPQQPKLQNLPGKKPSFSPNFQSTPHSAHTRTPPESST